MNLGVHDCGEVKQAVAKKTAFENVVAGAVRQYRLRLNFQLVAAVLVEPATEETR